MAANTFDQVRVPFQKMTFAPDVPSTALGPNEYNSGKNVEADVRGIRSVAGDIEILNTIPGTPTYVSSGFRPGATVNDGASTFWFIVATTEGYWYASNGDTDWYNITPGGGPIAGYDQATNITEAWNGTIPFFNDTVGAPMFLPDEPNAILAQYSNLIQPTGISAMSVGTSTVTATFDPAYATAPYIAGQKIVVAGVSTYFDGTYTVVSCTASQVVYSSVPGAPVPSDLTDGSIAPAYTWNYNPNWSSYYANFLRLYSTPNVGSILVAGNLTVTETTSDITEFPVTIQWSQAFGLNQAPATWQPTITNVANQLEVPLRGPALDAFPCNGQFFLCSYWDTVVFSPINYSTTSAPILGVRLFNQGRGLLSSNCWANTDKLVYGVDARDIWVFDGTDFQGLGNQRVKNWFYDQLDPQYYDRVFMEVNSQRNQVEIYYPDSEAINGVPNKMLSYRYDLECWNAPRDVSSATMACESPIWFDSTDSSLPQWNAMLGSRTVVYARGVANQQLVQKDYGASWIDGAPIESVFRRDNLKLLPNYSGHLLLHRVLPEAVNLGATPALPGEPASNYNTSIIPSTGNITVTVDGADSVGATPAESTAGAIQLNTTDPWVQISQNAYRVNSIKLSNTSNTDVWICSAASFQYTQTQDDR